MHTTTGCGLVMSVVRKLWLTSQHGPERTVGKRLLQGDVASNGSPLGHPAQEAFAGFKCSVMACLSVAFQLLPGACSSRSDRIIRIIQKQYGLPSQQHRLDFFSMDSSVGTRWWNPRWSANRFHDRVSQERSNGAILGSSLFAYAAGFSFAYVGLSVGTGALLLFVAVQTTMHGYGLLVSECLHKRQVTGLLPVFAGLVCLLQLGISISPLGSALLMLGAGVSRGGRFFAWPSLEGGDLRDNCS